MLLIFRSPVPMAVRVDQILRAPRHLSHPLPGLSGEGTQTLMINLIYVQLKAA
jgi:hypothetical protein